MLLLGVFIFSTAGTLLIQPDPARQGKILLGEAAAGMVPDSRILLVIPGPELPYGPENRPERGLSGNFSKDGQHYREVGYRYRGDTLYVRIAPGSSGSLATALKRIIHFLPTTTGVPTGPRKAQTFPIRILLMGPTGRDLARLNEIPQIGLPRGSACTLILRPHIPLALPPDQGGSAICG